MPIDEELLARIRANDPTLKEINLLSQYPPLNADDMQQLSSALCGNINLKVLILGDNAIKDDGAVMLAAGIAKSHVEVVDVSVNDIGNIGISALIQAPLLSLDISGNSFSDNGLNLLANNSTLHSLFIHENGLTDNCAQFLLANTRLLEITLDGNELTPRKALAVQQHIQQNILLHVQKIVAEQLARYVPSLPAPDKAATKQSIDEVFTKQPEGKSLLPAIPTTFLHFSP